MNHSASSGKPRVIVFLSLKCPRTRIVPTGRVTQVIERTTEISLSGVRRTYSHGWGRPALARQSFGGILSPLAFTSSSQASAAIDCSFSTKKRTFTQSTWSDTFRIVHRSAGCPFSSVASAIESRRSRESVVSRALVAPIGVDCCSGDCTVVHGWAVQAQPTTSGRVSAMRWRITSPMHWK